MTKKQVSEIDLLELYVDEMEREGANKNLVRISIDGALVEVFCAKHGTDITLEQLQKMADKCLANEWLEYRVLAGQYGMLGLTTAGFGVVRSRQRKQEALAKRTTLKKMSDYIEDHKGLFVAIGIAIALAGVLVSLFRG